MPVICVRSTFGFLVLTFAETEVKVVRDVGEREGTRK